MPRYLIIILLLTSIGASAEETERLQGQIPEQWIQVVDKQVGAIGITEFLPANSKDTWQQKLSLEALSGEALPDPLEFGKGLADQQRDLCHQFNAQAIFSGFENGYPTVVQLMQCQRNINSGKPLVTMVKIIKGNQALYTISRFWRPEAKPEDIPGEEIAAWSATLKKFKVCDAALDAHPCESS